jgi:predicted metalloprotease
MKTLATVRDHANRSAARSATSSPIGCRPLMRTGALIVLLAGALSLAGCGDEKSKPPKPSPANKRIKAPAKPQPASATKRPGKATIADLPKAEKPGEGQPAPLKGLEGKSIEEKLEIFAVDIGEFWQRGFSKTRIQFRPATVYIISAPQQIGCDPPGTIDENGNNDYASFYCPADSSLSLPVRQFEAIADNPKYGDVGAATHVAIGYGFHVENVAGIWDNGTDEERFFTAVCLGGVWTSSVYRRGLFDPDDAAKIGTAFREQIAPGRREVVQAFVAGFESGNPARCVQSSGDPGPSG